MPTRTGTKPSSYTFSSSGQGANMEGGWIFISGDVSGSDVTDITGNGNTITLQGTASIGSTDATHGDCLDPGDSGANFDPPAGWDSFGDYSIIFGVRIDDNTNTSGGTETLMFFENTSSGTDPANVTWATSENVSGRMEDGGGGATATITDGFLNNATEWATVAITLDSATGDINLYVSIDGETTQTATSAASAVSGSATSNLFTIGAPNSGNPWHGLIEYCYVYSRELSAADVDAIHVDPYSMLSGGGGGGSVAPLAVHHINQMKGS